MGVVAMPKEVKKRLKEEAKWVAIWGPRSSHGENERVVGDWLASVVFWVGDDQRLQEETYVAASNKNF